MSYQTRLVNSPFEKQLFTPMYKVDNGFFTEDECNYINIMMSMKPLNKGEQFTTYADDPLNQRNAKTFFIDQPDNETRWIYDKLNTVISYYNDNYFNFELTGYQYLQYTEYDPGGKHEFHMDLAMGVPNDITYYINENLRKLTVVLILNKPGVDFTGGEFQINHFSEKYPENIPVQQGSVIMFPSYMLHRVAPVLSGNRKTMVAWAIGPKFK